MISYECNIMCDLCRNQVVCGALSPTVTAAERNSEMLAIKQGWIYRKEKWFCPDCKPKLCPACQAEAVEES